VRLDEAGVTRRPSTSSASRAVPAEGPTATMRPSAIARSAGSSRSGRRQLRSTRSSTRGQYADFFSGEKSRGARVASGGHVGSWPRASCDACGTRRQGWVRDGVVTAQASRDDSRALSGVRPLVPAAHRDLLGARRCARRPRRRSPSSRTTGTRSALGQARRRADFAPRRHAGGLVLRARGHGLMGEGLFRAGGGLFRSASRSSARSTTWPGASRTPSSCGGLLLLPAAYVLPSIALICARLARRLGVVLDVRPRSYDLARPRHLFERKPRRRSFGAAGVLVWALGALHGDGEFRRARQLLEQLGLLTILVAMVPLGLLRQLGAWWSSGEATRWPVAVLVLIGLAAVASASRRSVFRTIAPSSAPGPRRRSSSCSSISSP